MSKNQEQIAIEELMKQTKLSHQNIIGMIRNLNEELRGIMEIENDLVFIPKKQKMILVNKAITLGITLDQIIERLHWREFENFCLFVLEHHEFQSVQNFHFTQRKKRYEIDVIGWRKPLIFAIDAKKWKTGHAGALKTMVKNQIKRGKALSQSLQKRTIRQKLNLSGWKSAKIIPMIVTSKMYEIKIFEQVPVIPFFKFNQFINDYHRYSEIILHIPAYPSSQKTLITKKLTESIKRS